MQSMNQPAMEPVPETVMPTTNNMPMNDNFNQIPLPQPEQNIPAFQPATEQQPMFVQPTPDANMNNSFAPVDGFITQNENNFMQPSAPVVEPQPTFGFQQPAGEQTISPMVNDTPLFGPAPMETTQPVTPQPEINLPMEDVPLFNQNITIPGADTQMVETITPMQQTINESIKTPEEPALFTPNSFEIPVVNQETEMSPVESAPVEQDRLTQLQELLNANGYTFKTFSNETDNCIIIELPRN